MSNRLKSIQDNMQLYNTLTRTLEYFTPQVPGDVSLYTCGQTVYDYAHIGNYAAYTRWDVLARVLKESGYAVEWVMNITDVGHLVSDADEGEDKLEKGAQREGKTAWEIAKFYGDDFIAGLHALNFIPPARIVKATEHIPEQIALVKTLEDKGFTYIIDDGVYFDTAALGDYGKLTGQNRLDLKTGARVEANSQKRHPGDFALWKFSPQDRRRDMEWESPWGLGFPGWHVECSAMAMKYLGETIDIHAGGIDHIPIHHTNEIAQSEAATGKPFSRVWLHANHMMVGGAKIAKSTGNGITLHDLARKNIAPLDLRMLYLQSHYRTQANFTWGGLEAAAQRRHHLQAFADLRFQTVEGGELNGESFTQTREVILRELQNDLHTPEVLVALHSLAEAAQTYLVAPDAKKTFDDFVEYIDRVLGLDFGASTDLTAAQHAFIKEREAARGRKDFTRADEIRDALEKQHIYVRDTPLGTIWKRL